MIKTRAGLPNTCSQCGTPCVEEWYAIHVDAALAGAGLCAMCAGVEPVSLAAREAATNPPAQSPAQPTVPQRAYTRRRNPKA
jgi:hypothetical protein